MGWAVEKHISVTKQVKANLLIFSWSNRHGRAGCGSQLWIHWRQSSDMSLSWFFLWNCSRGARLCILQAPWTYCSIPFPFSCRLPRSMCYSDYISRPNLRSLVLSIVSVNIVHTGESFLVVISPVTSPLWSERRRWVQYKCNFRLLLYAFYLHCLMNSKYL